MVMITNDQFTHRQLHPGAVGHCDKSVESPTWKWRLPPVAKHFGVVDPTELGGGGQVERGANMSLDESQTFMANDSSGEMLATEPNPRGLFSKVIAAIGGTADYCKIKPALDCLEGRDTLAHYFLVNWPSLSHFHFMPDGLGLMLLIAIDHERTAVYVEWWMPTVEKFDERLLLAALIVFGNQILDEDGAMTQRRGRPRLRRRLCHRRSLER